MRAWNGDDQIDLGSPQQRSVLALLLLHRHEDVTSEMMVESLWEHAAPKAALSTVRTYVYRLRRALDRIADTQVVLARSSGGYRLVVGDADIDVEDFERDLAAARRARASGELHESLLRYEQALSQWQGTTVAKGSVGHFIARERRRLEQLKFSASEELAEVEIRLGRHAEALAELWSLTAAQPLRERSWALTLHALYALGRRADALSAYQNVRQALNCELGLDPGPELQDLHRRVLLGEPLAPAGAAVPPAAAGTVSLRSRHPYVPAQLPPPLDTFMGRDMEMTAATSWLLHGQGPSVVSVSGPVGQGKTAFAVQAAHRLSSRFPDGQLYAQLVDHGDNPADVSQLLTGFLCALGVPTGSAPSLSELIALWHTALEGKRVLIVLDDALGVSQILPLLPTNSASATLITSWREMLDLPQKRAVTVPSLTRTEGLQLLNTLTGQSHFSHEGQHVARIVDQCLGRPLALREAAAKLAKRSLTFVHEVPDVRNFPARELSAAPSPSASLADRYRRVFGRLDPATAMAFRVLALAGQARFSCATAAQLLDVPEAAAYRSLDTLCTMHLVQYHLNDGTFSVDRLAVRHLRAQEPTHEAS
ncbi:transcriptional regulator [Streptomyces prasinus]|uniref:AfsR/SARP family transcriptional regulator n=1 Tax=Streptomyces prasinus TaxID=67345 RepID=UPI00331B817D